MDIFSKDDLMKWLELSKVDAPFDRAAYCQSRDIFQARLDNLYQETKNPLLVAVAGEIGNNSFDHNLGSWLDIPGVHFSNRERILAIADRGQGVRKTLARIIKNIKSDKDAVEIAFTKTISGRSPEQRGNGLKFVALAAKENNWDLYFQSGTGAVKISSGSMDFSEAPALILGCAAIIKY